MSRKVEDKVEQPDVNRGLGHDAVVAVVAATAGSVVKPVVEHVTSQILNREPKEPSKIVLPPGVSDE